MRISGLVVRRWMTGLNRVGPSDFRSLDLRQVLDELRAAAGRPRVPDGLPGNAPPRGLSPDQAEAFLTNDMVRLERSVEARLGGIRTFHSTRPTAEVIDFAIRSWMDKTYRRVEPKGTYDTVELLNDLTEEMAIQAGPPKPRARRTR